MSTTLSLSDMIYPVLTYGGNLDFSEEFAEENNDNEDNFDWEEYKQEISKISDKLLRDTLEKVLSKYDIKLVKFSFYTPMAYNYANDSIDITLEYGEKDYKEDLRGEIEYYIENIRKKSYDGYMSLEPDTFDEVKMDDYAYLYAILKKENILDTIKDIIENDFIDEVRELYQNMCY